MYYNLKISLNITLIESLGPCYFRLGVGTCSVLRINAVVSRRLPPLPAKKPQSPRVKKSWITTKKTPTAAHLRYGGLKVAACCFPWAGGCSLAICHRPCPCWGWDTWQGHVSTERSLEGPPPRPLPYTFSGECSHPSSAGARV